LGNAAKGGTDTVSKIFDLGNGGSDLSLENVNIPQHATQTGVVSDGRRASPAHKKVLTRAILIKLIRATGEEGKIDSWRKEGSLVEPGRGANGGGGAQTCRQTCKFRRGIEHTDSSSKKREKGDYLTPET